MRIPNMCLVLKLDNGKVFFLANGQTHRVTQPSSTVLVYRYTNVYMSRRMSRVADTENSYNLSHTSSNHQVQILVWDELAQLNKQKGN